LTVPHSGSVSRDIAQLSAAWKRFRRRLKKLFGKKVDFPYWRSLEVAGSVRGHAHYHVWLLSPYVPRQVLAHAWGESLDAEYQERTPRITAQTAVEGLTHPAGVAAVLDCGAWLWAPVVDVRAANEDAGSYLVKYLVKDTVADGSYMEPARYALIYAALEGARGVAASVRFDVPVEREKLGQFCPCCGGELRVTFEDVPRVPVRESS